MMLLLYFESFMFRTLFFHIIMEGFPCLWFFCYFFFLLYQIVSKMLGQYVYT